jgi:hypothetical protein
MYEVEFKAELTAIEREKLITLFKKKGFVFTGVSQQNDFYVHAVKSPYSGYDLIRYRDEDGTYIFTEKIWELVEGMPARRENEHEVTKDIFETEIAKAKQLVTIMKKREWFEGRYKDTEISITIDSVKFGHSAHLRYFIEAEVDTEDKGKVKELKALEKLFLEEMLSKKEVIEAPGMFTMAFEKR